MLPIFSFSQINEKVEDSLSDYHIFIEGDSIARSSIDLDEVMLLHKLKFNSKQDRRRYLILKRKTIKVYPYAKMAAERLDTMNKRLAAMTKNSQKSEDILGVFRNILKVNLKTNLKN